MVVAAAVYFNSFYTPKCESFECFKNKMIACSRASYINEEPEASWGYYIRGTSGGACKVDVMLLLAKKGELGVDKLTGKGMVCYYPLEMYAYPEKDLSKCHGLLKEDLQTIVISKLHAYVLENLGKVEKGLEEAL